MVRRMTRCLLPALLASLVMMTPASAQQAPPGYQLLTAPQTSGGLLLARREGVASAMQLLVRGLRDATSFFGRRPEAFAGVAQIQDDRYAEAYFRVPSPQGILIGVAFAGIGPSAGTLGLVFDTPHTLGQSLPRLLQLVGPSEGGSATGCAPPPQRWQIVPFPDGSGQLELPENWRMTGGGKGIWVSAEGPHGYILRAAQVRLLTRAAALQTPQVPFPVADPTDPVTPYLAVRAWMATLQAQQGLPPVRVTRVLRVTPMQPTQGFLHDAHLEIELDYAGRPFRALTHVVVGGVIGGSYLFQESGASAPAECFAEYLPTLMRILGTAQTAPHVINEALQRALQSQREAHDIWWDATRNQDRARDRMAANWTEVFRGTRVIEDTRTSTRGEVNLAYSEDIVRRLNQQEGYERYREIPLRDLNQ